MRWLIRIVSWLAAVLVGVVYGAAGTFAHGVLWGPLPIGLAVALLGSGALLIAVRALTGDRIIALATGLGMVAAALVASGVGPGGSILVPDTPLGRVWTYALGGAVLVVVLWPRRAPRR